MFIQAKTPIKIAADTVITEATPPIEVDDKTGAELVRIGAADEVEVPQAIEVETDTTKSAKAKK